MSTVASEPRRTSWEPSEQSVAEVAEVRTEPGGCWCDPEEVVDGCDSWARRLRSEAWGSNESQADV